MNGLNNSIQGEGPWAYFLRTQRCHLNLCIDFKHINIFVEGTSTQHKQHKKNIPTTSLRQHKTNNNKMSLIHVLFTSQVKLHFNKFRKKLIKQRTHAVCKHLLRYLIRNNHSHMKKSNKNKDFAIDYNNSLWNQQHQSQY